MKCFILIISMLLSSTCFAEDIKIDSVLVKKSEKKMYLISENKPVKEYDVVFGKNPVGHKQEEGDEKTPEGKYFIDKKNENSDYHLSLQISYPNSEDKARAKSLNVLPGGDIMIHGQTNGFGWFSPIVQLFNWTDGCVAVSNSEIEEIYKLVPIGTPVEIRP